LLVSPYINGYIFPPEVISIESAIVKRDKDLPKYSESLKLTIPSIGLSSEVIEGKSMKESLEKGLWRVPYTSFPGEGGNTVIVGHSIDYSQWKPPHFFYLNRVVEGDYIYAEYNGELFKYLVYEKSVVKMSAVEYENISVTEEIITLYTCTPVVNPIYRLVIVGKVVSNG
jgi:sortase A